MGVIQLCYYASLEHSLLEGIVSEVLPLAIISIVIIVLLHIYIFTFSAMSLMHFGLKIVRVNVDSK